jgi:hypothetical protein
VPLTKQDVVDTLNSYFVSQMNFRIERVHVSPQNYDEVRVLTEDGDIPVVEGTASNAYYKPPHQHSDHAERQSAGRY